jgi:hypothetical protein
MKTLTLKLVKWIALLLVGFVALSLTLGAILEKVDPDGMAKIRSDRETKAKIEANEKDAKAKEGLAKVDSAKAQAEEAAKIKADAIAAQELEPVAMISALKLSQAYDDNPIAADSRFKGNRVIVTGRIDHMGRDILGSPYIVLENDVQCGFSKADEAIVAGFKKGQKVAITGTVRGLILVGVYVKNCELTADSDIDNQSRIAKKH